MYGLEKGKKDNKGKFMFDLEVEIKQHPKRGQELLEKTEHRIQAIKKTLREGAKEGEFDKLGILLHGYTALQKVLKKAVK
jgi:hypothetical protein